MLVSIITPSFNCQNTIKKTIKSVMNQTYQNWEMIIVDDCSTDGSLEIIERFISNEPRIKLIRSSWNGGAAVARNTGISIAKGRFIAFLDSDDLWHETKLEKQIQFMLDNNVELSYTPYNRYHANGTLLGAFFPKSKLTYKDILKSNSIGCLTAIYDTQRIGKVFMPNISKRQDMGLWLRILKQVEYAHCYNEVLADYLAVQENSVSSNKLTAAKFQWRLYREVEKLDLKTSLYNFVNYFYYGVKKSKA
ncbi:glycosyltransferase family 2 protein [Vibrio hyugaensis]|nr:glycosyltransferase family 2 protein [Vibrio hyugaensis]